MKKIINKILSVLLFSSLAVNITSCTPDPYKDYVATGLEAKKFMWNYDEKNSFGYNRSEIFSDYQEYSVYNFDLAYTKNYFENNDLLVFVVSCCSSDEMAFQEILKDNGKLYPLFLRKEIGVNEPVTSDFIVLSYYVELAKSENYQAGEIIYEFK